jgi:hypothetical protein
MLTSTDTPYSSRVLGPDTPLTLTQHALLPMFKCPLSLPFPFSAPGAAQPPLLPQRPAPHLQCYHGGRATGGMQAGGRGVGTRDALSHTLTCPRCAWAPVRGVAVCVAGAPGPGGRGLPSSLPFYFPSAFVVRIAAQHHACPAYSCAPTPFGTCKPSARPSAPTRTSLPAVRLQLVAGGGEGQLGEGRGLTVVVYGSVRSRFTDRSGRTQVGAGGSWIVCVCVRARACIRVRAPVGPRGVPLPSTSLESLQRQRAVFSVLTSSAAHPSQEYFLGTGGVLGLLSALVGTTLSGEGCSPALGLPTVPV